MWLTKMPPVSGVASANDWHSDLQDGEFWFWFMDIAIYMIQTNAERDIFMQTLYERKAAIQSWIWSHFVKALTSPAHDVTFEWWKGSGLVKEIKHVAIRASYGGYVAPLTSSKLHDWEPRGQLRARKFELEPDGLFRFIFWKDGRVSFYASNQQYVAADQYSDLAGTHIQSELVANKDWVGDWERFQLHNLGQNKVAFRASNGRYVRVNVPEHTKIIADLVEVDEQLSSFEIVELKPRMLKQLSLKCIKPQDSDGVDLCDIWVSVDGQTKLLGNRRKLRAGNVAYIPVGYTFYVNVIISVGRFSDGFIGSPLWFIPIPLGSLTIDYKSSPGLSTVRFTDSDNSFEYELEYEIGEDK